MTPQEKAKELVEKFLIDENGNKIESLDTNQYKEQGQIITHLWIKAKSDYEKAHQRAKQCALIAVGEILKTHPNNLKEVTEEKDGISAFFEWRVEYWQQVKQEIDKL